MSGEEACAHCGANDWLLAGWSVLYSTDHTDQVPAWCSNCERMKVFVSLK